MTKTIWKAGTMLYPIPAAMVSCGANADEYNILTISWTGTVCSDPPMCYISVRPQRHSYEIIKRNGCFVINLPNKQLTFAADWCGVKSGKDFNKFKEMNLTPVAASKVNAPIILEAPINIECVVKQIIPLGSHDMFLSEIVAVQADNQYINPKTDALDLVSANLIAYSHGKYQLLGETIGKFGYSVKKNKKN